MCSVPKNQQALKAFSNLEEVAQHYMTVYRPSLYIYMQSIYLYIESIYLSIVCLYSADFESLAGMTGSSERRKS